LILRPGLPSAYHSPPIGVAPSGFIAGLLLPKIPPFVGDGVLRSALILTAHICCGSPRIHPMPLRSGEDLGWTLIAVAASNGAFAL
jgi:hypothetical protein